MKIIQCFFASLIIISPISLALPKVTVSFDESLDGFVRVKIQNETFEPLACFVAIDGHKAKFQLLAKSSSRWFRATDKRFNYRNFSTWCDYLDVHPAYRIYQAY
ncbi:MAG: hypothetical protein WBC60_05205 [Cognaticolwellia sp.]